MSANKIPPAPTWDLDSIFPGGSTSPEFKKHREKTDRSLKRAEKLFSDLPDLKNQDAVTRWADMIELLQSLEENIQLIEALAGCLVCQNVDDTPAHAIAAEGDVFATRWKKLLSQLEAVSLRQSDTNWKKLMTEPRMSGIVFYLDELRTIARSKLPLEQEQLALDLAVDGLHAWNRLYDKTAGDIKVDFKVGKKTEKISMGQIATKMSDADRAVRQQAFEKMYEGWKPYINQTAMMLNAIAGFRLTLHTKRGWESPLVEALQIGRLKKKTLDTMWRVVAEVTPQLKPYIDAKKRLLGIDKFSWYDQFAPCGKADKLYSFEDAGNLIVDHARGFSDDMADFFRMALDKRWVEAENRPGKAGGGWCAGMGPVKESRIFMTYSGTFENLLTLSHELGHAYHHHVLKDHPAFAGGYPMCLAETASIFSETLTMDAALKQTTEPMERILLIEQKLQAAYTMFCDLHCRYLFERDLYEARREGVSGPDKLSEIMTSAQERAFGSLLDKDGYHPQFWATKLHFYLSGLPYYNFPYTFGFLFAGGVYDRAHKEGAAFADKYRALLADTGSMTCEQLARKHLGVDLTREDFWLDACRRAVADVDEFVKLVKEIS
ncbi:MAG TPA: M3 family oligoendopeptidase [candidate division Zixibacteria bacterium]|nr:M3 family oligoendopeptidase [candidate division Zixibacteria bacterium]